MEARNLRNLQKFMLRATKIISRIACYKVNPVSSLTRNLEPTLSNVHNSEHKTIHTS